MPSSGMLRSVALVRTDESEKHNAYIIRVTQIGERGMLAVTSNRYMRQGNTMQECSVRWLLVTANVVPINVYIIYFHP
jgi:hypothetical protein